MNLSGKKIGIWGYGIVGKSATRYLQQLSCTLTVCDQRACSPEEQAYLDAHQVPFYAQDNLSLFLETNDYIIPSPGIDISSYTHFAHKWISELDIFAQAWHKPIIAITGTVGKTTVTHLIGLLLQHARIRAIVGGNIGYGMLSLIEAQKNVDYAVLELSSWQLEYNTLCAPTIALWTTFAENHLDRHITMQRYFDAKYQIIAQQTKEQTAIIPLILMHDIYARNPQSRCIFFYHGLPDKSTYMNIKKEDTLWYFDNNAFYAVTNNNMRCIATSITLPEYSFASNWIAIAALLHTLSLPIHLINHLDRNTCTQPHRFELIGTYNGITIYNDSKATTAISTIASVNKCVGKRIHLILGGLSKGVDRTPLIQTIKDTVHTIYCFGKESDILKSICNQLNIQSYAFDTLEKTVKTCIKNCQPEDIILFSPAGSSYDLFKDYADRGECFKNSIKEELLQVKR